jgi:hypothetical protein
MGERVAGSRGRGKCFSVETAGVRISVAMDQGAGEVCRARRLARIAAY